MKAEFETYCENSFCRIQCVLIWHYFTFAFLSCGSFLVHDDQWVAGLVNMSFVFTVLRHVGRLLSKVVLIIQVVVSQVLNKYSVWKKVLKRDLNWSSLKIQGRLTLTAFVRILSQLPHCSFLDVVHTHWCFIFLNMNYFTHTCVLWVLHKDMSDYVTV